MSFKVLNKQGNKALIKGKGKSFTVTMQDWLKNLVCVGDIAIIKKSYVSNEWIMTDYIRYVDEVAT